MYLACLLAAAGLIGGAGAPAARAAGGGAAAATAATPASGGAAQKQSAERQAVLDEALKHIGKPYRSPASAPASFDCSAFAGYVFKQAVGQNLPSSSAAFASVGETITFKDARPGDILIFVNPIGSTKIDHVGILYQKSESGELRGSQVIHAISVAGGQAVLKGSPTGVVLYELGKRGDGNWQKEYFLSRHFKTIRVLP
ncbi:MAG: C40 family peptidase [Treponema sp.]|jgi:cell wall-associated NlpC family hydrolase|nr:C40 family peptidase [Treponema sp.]